MCSDFFLHKSLFKPANNSCLILCSILNHSFLINSFLCVWNYSVCETVGGPVPILTQDAKINWALLILGEKKTIPLTVPPSDCCPIQSSQCKLICGEMLTEFIIPIVDWESSLKFTSICAHVSFNLKIIQDLPFVFSFSDKEKENLFTFMVKSYLWKKWFHLNRNLKEKKENWFLLLHLCSHECQ